MIAQKNRHYIEMLLRGDNSYEFKPEIENITELQEFIKGLFEITDEFNIKEKQPSKDKLKEHLTEVKDYVVDNVGQNSKLVEDSHDTDGEGYPASGNEISYGTIIVSMDMAASAGTTDRAGFTFGYEHFHVPVKEIF